MSEEWITGGPPARPWTEGRQLEGMPGVGVGPGCRVEAMADERARVVLAGDVCLGRDRKAALLDAAADGRWADLTRCPGSYWVVAQNSTNRFVCGDLAGFRTVFHTEIGARTVWSTSARELAELRQAGPDLALVAARVVAGSEHWPDRTVYEGVFGVPGGKGLLLGGPRPQLIDVTGIDPVASLDEGAAAFGQALERSVHWRMRDVGGLAGADVSGGLDSSALAITAARVGKVRAVTYSDVYTSAEDLAFARRVAEHIGVELHVGWGGLEQLPFGWSSSQPVTEQPAATSLTMGQHALYLRPAANLPVHFTGNGGDVVLDSCSAVWVAMVQAGERRAAHREVTNWARARNRSPRDLWASVTRSADIGVAGALDEAAAQMESGSFDGKRPGVWSWCHLGQSGRWLTPAGRHQVAALLRGAAQASTPERADVFEQHASLRLVGADARDTAPLAASLGIRQVHPYLDNEVVRAAFAIAPAERHGVTSFKPLLGAALPYLPWWLTSRTSKGSFSRQFIVGLVHHRKAIAHLIRSSALATGGLLDPEPAIATLASVQGAQAHALYDLQRLTMVCQWLASTGHSAPLEEAC
ncbi:asparagine synthase-related protein [Streptomyces sp. BP-8]|uniref:Asparagine synthase-related protein n=1 Tax=Streptomyces sirii TaxID=3127701 RepID=A0ABZ2QKF6_9ACTN